MRVVLVGGGSGGHFYPLIAISEALIKQTPTDVAQLIELYYMGPNPYDDSALNLLNIKFIYCPAGKQRKYHSLLNFLDTFKVLIGIIIAIWKLFILYPDIVMSKGGYTSVPVTFAAWILRIPIVIHESDAVPGRANKFAAKAARYIAISYQEAGTFFPAKKTALTGNPLRKALLSTETVPPESPIHVDPERPTILILGGSLGAERINNLILQSLDELLPHYNIIHQTGETKFDIVNQSAKSLIQDQDLLSYYHLVSFMDAHTYSTALQTAVLIVSRAGSGTIYDIATHGKPSILIPIPEDISHDQRTNAYAYARGGGASVMEESNLTDSLLVAEITRIIGDQALYSQMSASALQFAPTDAADKIATILWKIANEHVH